MSDKNFKVKNGIDANGAVTITQPTTSTVPLTILANTLATGSNLLEVKRPDGTVRFAVGNDGALTVNSNISFNGGSMSMYPGNSGQTALTVFGQTNQSVANLIVRAATGQSGNLQEWRDQNGNLAVSIGADFALRGIAGGFFGTASGNIVGTNYLGVKGWAAGHIPFVVQGFSSQTGDLTRWVDSNANTLAKVDASGSITAVDLTLSGNLTVNGTTTNLNSTNLVIEDKNIIIADVATPTDTTADGAGITIKGATDKTFNWVQSTGSFTLSDPLIINTNSTTKQNLIIKGIASQTANLQEWQDNSGTVIASVSSSGAFISNSSFLTGGTLRGTGSLIVGGTTGISSVRASIYTNSTTTVGLVIQGAASQTANLQEWQDSTGAVLANMEAGGFLRLTREARIAQTNAGEKLLVLRGAASQTADLQQWQRSDGTYDLAFNNGAGSLNKLVFTDARAWGIYWGAEPLLNTSTGYLIVKSWSEDRPAFVVRARAGQSNALQIWQDSSGGTKSYVDQDGVIYASSGLITGTASAHIGTYRPNIKLNINNNYAGDNPLSIKGAASQTSDYLYIANSAGSFIASISSSGQFISAAKSLNLDSGNLSFGYGGGGSSGNLAIGTYALNSNTTGNVNLALGSYALQNNTTGGYNVAIGTGSLYYNVSGGGNTAIGSVALQNNLVNDQTAIGIASLFSATTGYANTGLGSSALNKVTTGILNIAVGRLSGYKLTSGSANTIIGSLAMYNGDTEVSTGSNNTVIGYESGAANLGSGNVFIGFQSAKNETGSNKLYISNSSTSTPLIGGDFSAGTLSLSANTFITAQSTSVAPLIVKYITGQSGNIQEWRNEANGVMSYINVYGSFFTSNNVGGSSGSFGPSIVGNPSGVVLTSQGMSGQTGDLQQWKNSNGTVLASINSDGSFALSRSQYTSASLGVWASVNSDPSGGNSGIGLVIKTYNATSRGIGIFGSASQTADLQQWGNSAGTVLAYVNSEGSIYSANRIVAPGDFEGRSNSFLGSPSFNLATLNISTRATNQSGIVVRGAASQTADLQQWQNSAGTVLNSIASDGTFKFTNSVWHKSTSDSQDRVYYEPYSSSYYKSANGHIFRNSTDTTILTINNVGNVLVNGFTASTVGLTVKGAASQTGNLQEWQNSAGTVLAKVDKDGNFSNVAAFASVSATSVSAIGGNITTTYGLYSNLPASTDAGVAVQPWGANIRGALVKGFAAQTANLQEWQDSSGNILAAIRNDGVLRVSQIISKENYSSYFSFASGSPIQVNPLTAGTVGIIVKGVASQTANLTEWQDSSGSTWAHVGLSGSRFGANGSQGATFIDQYGNLTVRSNSTVFGNSIVSVGTAGATSTGITVRGVTSQTASLQEWQDSTGLVLSKVDSAGRWYGTDGLFSLGVAVGATGSPGPNLYVKSRFASQVASAFRGYASQTANLTEWQNSDGTVLAKVDANGSAQFLGLNVQGTGSGVVNIGTAAAGYVGLIIRGVSSQSADLQQWQNSNGDVVANITSTGRLRVTAEVIGTGSYVVLGSNGGLSEVVYLGYNYTTSIGAGGIVFNRTVRPPDTSTVGIIIRGNASQTANLQEWQDSAGTALALVSNVGTVRASVFANLTPSLTYIATNFDTSGIGIVTSSAAQKGLIVRGAASQTANLQEWQNSAGQVRAKIDSYGGFSSLATTTISNDLNGTGTSLVVQTKDAGGIPIVVKGFTSQTANLQEWQNSSGTVIANIYPNGTAGLYGLEVFTGGAGITGNYGNTDTLQVRINGAARRGILVKGAASQTANLQEWQNSDGAVLAKIDPLGNFTATSKSFDINHPTKENMRLRYGSLEGPENGVYIRGTAQSSIIELPEYWTGLVHEDSITVSLTSIGSAQNIYVEKIENNKIYIGGNLEKAFFTVYGERKDIDKLTVEY